MRSSRVRFLEYTRLKARHDTAAAPSLSSLVRLKNFLTSLTWTELLMCLSIRMYWLGMVFELGALNPGLRVAFLAHKVGYLSGVCNAEECGLIADWLNLFATNYLGIRRDLLCYL
jgi:hypothetical protein